MIVLNAATGGSKPAGAPAQTIKLAGTISAAGKHRGTSGGIIVVSGEHIKLANAKIDASGRRGGGKVLIGGDWGGGRPDMTLVSNPSAKRENYTIASATTVSVDAATTINASATRRGNGGKVVLWSDSQTTFAGTILAKGGAESGDGGFVETSSHGQLAFTGNVDASAPRGATGTLLLDPSDFYIVPDCFGKCAPSTMTGTQISNLLATQNVVVATNNSLNPPSQHGDIFVFPLTNITWGSGKSLTLSAYRDINIFGGAIIKNTAAGNLVLRADNSGTGSGTVNLLPLARVDFSQGTGTVSIYYNPSGEAGKYQNPTNYSCSGLCFRGGVLVQQPSQLTAYMLVNSATDLRMMETVGANLTGTYALGKSFSAAGFSGFAPGRTFAGLIDGNGGISAANYTISDLTVTLFPVIGNSATVSNFNLADVNVMSTGSSMFVGTLAGENRGTISNVHVLSGTVGGESQPGISVGGLVALNNGIIQQSSSAAAVSGGAFSSVGGLVATNPGTITGSAASGGVSVGANGSAGGLVAFNSGSVTNASATGSITGAAGAGGITTLGGLAGINQGLISGSKASGNVGSPIVANLQAGGLVGSNLGAIQSSAALGNVQAGDSSIVGGLVATNPGSISGSSSTGATISGGALSLVGGLVGGNPGMVAGSSASGAANVGTNGTAGGLVALNTGSITNALASGNVTGAAGAGGLTTLGGLAGTNQGVITVSSASGNVGSATVANLQAGGLVGSNSGTIESSVALGSVQTGDSSTAGGLAATNSVCAGCVNGAALIQNANASGNVSVGAASIAGGLVGTGNGTILFSSATGSVTGGGNSVLGGFIGTLTFENGPGQITSSSSSGAVTSTGSNSTVGGFAGLTSGTILASGASGPVTGTSDSYLGGFVGVNLGSIQQSFTTAAASVTGTGNRDVIGGFVGANFGSIDFSTAAGNATGATDSAVGAFAGANATFVNFSAGSIPNSSFPDGTITNSFATGTASGGPGSTVDPFIALVDPTTAANPPAFPSIVFGCTDPTCVFVSTGLLPSPQTSPLTSPTLSSSTSPLTSPTLSSSTSPLTSPTLSSSTSPPLLLLLPEFLASLAQQAQVSQNLAGTTQLAALSTPPVVNNIQGAIQLPPQPAPLPPAAGGGQQQLPPGFATRVIDIPPPNETRFIKDEVILQIAGNITLDRLQASVAQLGLTLLASENLALTGSTAVRFRITDGKSPADVIRALAAVQLVAVAQPNYVYTLEQAAPADQVPASRGDTGQQGDAAQYILEKLKMSDVHRMVRGTNIPIAVIDSEIDVAHPDLVGVVAQRFSAVGGAPEKPHAHGTGMAGAMAAHQRVLGTAPGARLLAVHAFSTNAATAESTTFNILKGIDWSVGQGARVINMSFAGPKDPSLQRALKLAYDKGIVLIAAAGNAGPKSPPLFPGADPFVIAVTATDVNDKLFTGANRGNYISVAAPGVDILVPAPENAYQLTTGTSVAAAEVSGIVALLLERNPKLTPADIRRILTASARRLAPGDRDDNFGAGLIDPLKALQLADPRTATTAPTPGTPPRRPQ
jgi:hypothetical protein